MAPSILSADFSKLGEDIQQVIDAGADVVHLDVMDGHFVPNITIGPVVIEGIRKVTDRPFWTHLMISDPEKYIAPFAKAGSDGIYVHPETGQDLQKLVGIMKDSGVMPGVSINPDTPIDVLDSVLPELRQILIMTVFPGFGGQSFMPETLPKIESLCKKISAFDHPPVIEVDGGINESTVRPVARAGARSIVAGSAIFHADDPAAALNAIRQAGEAAIDSV